MRNLLLKSIVSVTVFLLTVTFLNAQVTMQCDKKTFADYDYKALSVQKNMNSNTGIKYDITIPAMCSYRIFACPSKSLGSIAMVVFEIKYKKDSVLYDSRNANKGYFEELEMQTSKTLRIELISTVPSANTSGNVDIWIGTKAISKPKTKTKAKTIQKGTDDGIYTR